MEDRRYRQRRRNGVAQNRNRKPYAGFRPGRYRTLCGVRCGDVHGLQPGSSRAREPGGEPAVADGFQRRDGAATRTPRSGLGPGRRRRVGQADFRGKKLQDAGRQRRRLEDTAQAARGRHRAGDAGRFGKGYRDAPRRGCGRGVVRFWTVQHGDESVGEQCADG